MGALCNSSDDVGQAPLVLQAPFPETAPPPPAPRPRPQGRGFMEYNRAPLGYRAPEERIRDWKEVLDAKSTEERGAQLHTQSARCMECGTPFCHQIDTGCPLGNRCVGIAAPWAAHAH